MFFFCSLYLRVLFQLVKQDLQIPVSDLFLKMNHCDLTKMYVCNTFSNFLIILHNLATFKPKVSILTTLNTCNFASLQLCNFACLQLCMLATLHPSNFPSLQLCILATFHPCIFASLQLCILATLHPCNL